MPVKLCMLRVLEVRLICEQRRALPDGEWEVASAMMGWQRLAAHKGLLLRDSRLVQGHIILLPTASIAPGVSCQYPKQRGLGADLLR